MQKTNNKQQIHEKLRNIEKQASILYLGNELSAKLFWHQINAKF